MKELTTNCGKLPKEFNLSKRKMRFSKNQAFYYEEDIKEFIRLLKEYCKRNEGFVTELEIDKLVGKDLVEEDDEKSN